jgi:hypothetical protein
MVDYDCLILSSSHLHVMLILVLQQKRTEDKSSQGAFVAREKANSVGD